MDILGHLDVEEVVVAVGLLLSSSLLLHTGRAVMVEMEVLEPVY